MTATTREPHIGRNIKRIREILCIKQEYLALQMGLSQQAISQLEQREVVDAPTLEKVAKILNVPVEAIRNYDEEKAVNIVSNTFNSNDSSTLNAINTECTFNPLDKLMEVIEENKKLYERLVEGEREKVALMERLLAEKK